MSRLRVGDIEIEGSRVTIGGADPAASPARRAGPAQPGNAAALSLLQRIPVSPPALMAVGAVLAAFGTAVNVLVGVTTDPIGALLGGGVLAPLGAALVGVGLLKAYLGRRAHLPLVAALGGDSAPYVARLRALMAVPDSRCTVASLAAHTGWNEDTVVRTLALMREKEQVAEELDMATGQFYYTIHTLPPRDLDARLGKLHS